MKSMGQPLFCGTAKINNALQALGMVGHAGFEPATNWLKALGANPDFSKYFKQLAAAVCPIKIYQHCSTALKLRQVAPFYGTDFSSHSRANPPLFHPRHIRQHCHVRQWGGV